MGRYRKILVAVDGSESSKNAFRQACRLAGDGVFRITAVTAVPLYQDQFEVLGIKEKATRVLRDAGEKVLAWVRTAAEEEGVTVKTVLGEGSPFEVILGEALDGGHDLIVMGRRGKTAAERAFIGSNSARVIGHAPVDVLIIQKGASVGWEKLLLPTDGSCNSEEASVRAVNLARSYGSRLLSANVVDVTEDFHEKAPEAVEQIIQKSRSILAKVRAKAAEAGVKSETFVMEGEPYRAITDLARDNGAGVIVMGSHGRTGLKSLLMGSVTEKVIGHASCPVLVVK